MIPGKKINSEWGKGFFLLQKENAIYNCKNNLHHHSFNNIHSEFWCTQVVHQHPHECLFSN